MNKNVDCKNCSYRLALARRFDIHVDSLDCDKYGSDFCKAMNKQIAEPVEAKTINVKIPSKVICSYREKD